MRALLLGLALAMSAAHRSPPPSGQRILASYGFAPGG